jgi:hypothetical protein
MARIVEAELDNFPSTHCQQNHATRGMVAIALEVEMDVNAENGTGKPSKYVQFDGLVLADFPSPVASHRILLAISRSNFFLRAKYLFVHCMSSRSAPMLLILH